METCLSHYPKPLSSVHLLFFHLLLAGSFITVQIRDAKTQEYSSCLFVLLAVSLLWQLERLKYKNIHLDFHIHIHICEVPFRYFSEAPTRSRQARSSFRSAGIERGEPARSRPLNDCFKSILRTMQVEWTEAVKHEDIYLSS